MTKRLASKAILYATNQLEKGERVPVVVSELEVTPRYIRRLQAEFRERDPSTFRAFRAN